MLLTCNVQVVYAYNANETTHSESEIPWYQPLCGSFWSVSGFRQTHLGRICTHGLVCTLELLRIAPKGSAQVGDVVVFTWTDLLNVRPRVWLQPSKGTLVSALLSVATAEGGALSKTTCASNAAIDGHLS